MAVAQAKTPASESGRYQGKKNPREKPQGSRTLPSLQVEKAIGSDDEEKCEESDGHFTDGANGEGAKSLFAHFAEISAKADSGKG